MEKGRPRLSKKDMNIHPAIKPEAKPELIHSQKYVKELDEAAIQTRDKIVKDLGLDSELLLDRQEVDSNKNQDN